MEIEITRLGKAGSMQSELLRCISCQSEGGAEVGECLATATRIAEGDFDSWVTAWTHTADRSALHAQEALVNNHPVSAREAFLRGSNYYRAAEFYATHEDPRRYTLWQSSRICFQRAMSLANPPVEVVEIPYQGTSLPGYFAHGIGEGPRPTLLAMGGLDSACEELYYWCGVAAQRRGYNCLFFAGPGQHGALHLHPELRLRPDYEVPIKAVVDYAITRPEVDAERLALVGYSVGGHLALRAAAFEPRIRACIADPLTFDIGEEFRLTWPEWLRRAPRVIFDTVFQSLAHYNYRMRWMYGQVRWALGIKRPSELIAAWIPYTLSGLEERIRCPVLFLVGEDEMHKSNQVLVASSLRFFQALHASKAAHIFTSEEGAGWQCQMGQIRRGQALIFDWLDRCFASA